MLPGFGGLEVWVLWVGGERVVWGDGWRGRGVRTLEWMPPRPSVPSVGKGMSGETLGRMSVKRHVRK